MLGQKAYSFAKPPHDIREIERILGKGILTAEGEDHRRQRKILNSSFTRAQINAYHSIFQEQANKVSRGKHSVDRSFMQAN